MNDTIVVGVTDAPVARQAVDWAVARAASQGSGKGQRAAQSGTESQRATETPRVELVAVVGGAVGAVGEEAVVEEALAAAQHLLDTHVSRIEGEAPGVAVSTRVAAGNPVRLLIEASADASLLVIGSDYRGDGAGPARGAHGTRIAAGAACPVVVVPGVDVSGRSGVVVGIDGSPASEGALRFAAAEADRLGEKLVAVSVWSPLTAPRNSLAVYPELYLDNMQTATEEILALALAGLATDFPDLDVERIVERGYPSHVLNAIARDARMAVVGTHGRGALARFLLGSISQEVLGRLATVTAVVR